MCDPATAMILSTVASGMGTKMSMDATESANNERQTILNAAAEEQAKINDKKASTIEDFAQGTLTAPARDQRYEAAAVKQEGELTKALTEAGGKSGAGSEGKLSNDFARAKAESTAAAAEDIMKRARATARTNAGGLLYGQESLLGGDMASDVAGLTSQAGRYNRYAENAVKGVADNGSLVGGLLTGAAPQIAGYRSAPAKTA